MKKDDVKVMIGSGEHAIFVNKKPGEVYMLDDGTFVKVPKPVSFVKKLTKRISKGKRNEI